MNFLLTWHNLISGLLHHHHHPSPPPHHLGGGGGGMGVRDGYPNHPGYLGGGHGSSAPSGDGGSASGSPTPAAMAAAAAAAAAAMFHPPSLQDSESPDNKGQFNKMYYTQPWI